MAIYVGESVTVIAALVNPVSGAVIADATGTAEFYAPGKNPAKRPADRTPDQGPVPLVFDAAVPNRDGTVGAYVGHVETDGWAAGKWTFRATLGGSYDTWEYGSFTLQA